MEENQYNKNKFQQVVNESKTRMFNVLLKLLEKKKIGRVNINE